MRRTVGLTLLLVVVAIVVGVGVAWATFPSQSDLQKSSLRSLGVPDFIVESPIFQQYIDEITAPMQHDLADKARTSAIEGGIAALGVAAAGAILIEVERRRRPSDTAAPDAPPSDPQPPT